VTYLYVALAGGIGATGRWLVDLVAAARWGRAMPWGTIVANVSGSCVAGGLAGATLGAHLGPTWTAVLAVGLCGGFTTFSAASFDVAREFERRRPGLGLALLLAPMVLAVSAGIGGFHAAGG
jgi:fluoride exporter